MLPQVNEETDLPIPAHPDTLWEVEVKTAAPVRNSTETPLAGAVEAVLDVQRLMKGLIDLKRQDG
jgi:mediator of RNA polymerase II transcription subunit 18